MLLNPEDVLGSVMLCLAGQKDFGFQSIVSRPVDVVLFRLNEFVDGKSFGNDCRFEKVPWKHDELPVGRDFLDELADIPVDMVGKSSEAKDGFAEEMEIGLGFLLDEFQEATVGISGSCLTCLTVGVDYDLPSKDVGRRFDVLGTVLP